MCEEASTVAVWRGMGSSMTEVAVQEECDIPRTDGTLSNVCDPPGPRGHTLL